MPLGFRMLPAWPDRACDQVASSSVCFCRVGVRNVTALGNLISWQKVDYDFSYHQMEFPCNINVLIASEGRSLLPVRTKVKLYRVNAHHCPPLTRHAQPPPALPVGGRGRGGGGHVSCPHSWADSCHRRLSPASIAQPLVGCRNPFWTPASQCVANSPRNVPCAIPVYRSNGLPWQQLCATGPIPVLAQSFIFFSLSLVWQWRQRTL